MLGFGVKGSPVSDISSAMSTQPDITTTKSKMHHESLRYGNLVGFFGTHSPSPYILSRASIEYLSLLEGYVRELWLMAFARSP
jgi:hypothetical protein